MKPPSSIGWKINSHVAHETIDGEVVLINFATGAYYSLDNVGADIWAFLEAGTITDEIVRRISRRYEGNHIDVERAIVRLVDKLRQEGLIAADGTRTAKRVAAPAELDDAGPEKRRFEAPILRKYTDMQELIFLDPIHEVDDTGWPNRDPEPAKSD